MMPFQAMRLRAGGAAAATDPQWANVVSLLHFEGSNGSTTFTESASVGTYNVSGNAQISTARSKFGSASGLFDGNADFLVQTGSHNRIDPSNDFTVEAWIYRNGTGHDVLVTCYDNDSAGWLFGVGGTDKLYLFVNNGSFNGISSTASVPVGAWTHVAGTKQGNTLRVFIDGSLEGSLTMEANGVNGAASVRVGTDLLDTTRDFNGNMDELRLTRNVARYTASFTPPTAAFPNS